MSTFMGTSKPMGMQKKDYQETQQLKAEEEFKYHTNQRIQNIQFAIEMINKSLSESIANQGSDRKECEIQITQVMTSAMACLKDLRGMVEDLELRVDANKSLTNQLTEQLNNHVPRSEFNEKISHLHDCIKRLHTEKDSMRKEFNGLIDRLKLELDIKLKAQKDEILSIPSEVPNLRKVVDQKIELVELNGQNAVLRSANNENKILLVERKIDNLYQLIKKLEIAHEESK